MKTTFVMEDIAIKELKPHPKNPRKIASEAKKRLRDGLDKFGLVQPIIFNKRTGYIVGGHQRYSLISEKMQPDDKLQVAVIDVDEKAEAELIVFLNNTSSQGYWDEFALLDLVNTQQLEFDALGFNVTEKEYYGKLLQEEADRQTSSAEQYFAESAALHEEIEQDTKENKEETELFKKTRQERWEEVTKDIFEPYAQNDTVYTQEHKTNLETMRQGERKHYDKLEVLKIVFESEESKHRWLTTQGLPIKRILHESELSSVSAATSNSRRA